jgi:arylsulfatase A-like enzyme
MLSATFRAGPVHAADPLNVVIILADDLGYGDLGCYGHTKFQTPNLDRLAGEGARLTSFYTPAPYCAPTRASLMTGRYQFRSGMTRNPVPATDPIAKNADDIGLNLDEVTLGDAFRAAGYRTACIGKWHLGHRPQFRPLKRGFDEYLGILYSNDMHKVELIDGDKVVEYPVVQATLTKRYTERALRFLEQHKNKPFFLYLPHAMPHKPLAASEDFYQKSGHGLYADAVAEVDWSVGQLVNKLKELKLERNTLVLFTSDNGPWYGGSTGGLRGMKGLTWEGGIRVPLIARWPGKIPAGHVSDEPAVMMDLFPTALTAAGIALPKGRTLDGKDIMPLLTSTAKSPHEALFSLRNEQLSSVRSGKWKLHLVAPGAGKEKVWKTDEPYTDPRRPDGVRLLAPYEQAHPSQYPGVRTGDTVTAPALFDLAADRAEQHNVADKHPDVVKRLQGYADKIRAEIPKQAPPKKDPPKKEPTDADRLAKITHGPILGRPGAHEMGIWVRTSRPCEFAVHLGELPDGFTRYATGRTQLDSDNTGWVQLKGLKANTRYNYQVVPAGARHSDGTGGSFVTLPDSALYRQPQLNEKGLFNFRFEVGSCANQGQHSIGPDLPAYQTMLGRLKDKVHFAIMNGDFIYEEKRDFTPDEWLKQVGRKPADLPGVVRLAPTITGVWENYKLYLERGKPLAAWHRHVPSFFTFDDHEILNDVYGCGTAGLRDRRAVFRDVAVQAWYDYVGWSNPTAFPQGIHFGKAQLKAKGDVLTDPQADFTKLDLKQTANLHIHWGTPTAGVNDVKLDTAGGDPNAGVYDVVEVLDRNRLRISPAARQDGEASYSIGRRSYYRWRVSNCEFFALDTRTHREKHDFKNPEKPDISLLGKPQKEWLKDGMAKSDADFFFIVSTVPFAIPHNGAGGMSAASDDKDDAWTAFLAERDELVKLWDGLGKPVFVLTGDLHNSFAIKVSDRVWEFCCGPHNSANHPLGSEGNRPPNGPFTWRKRTCDIRWSTFVLDDVPQEQRRQPVYCVVQVNNVFNNPLKSGEDRWVTYPRPQVVFQYHDGRTGDLLYAEAIPAGK